MTVSERFARMTSLSAAIAHGDILPLDHETDRTTPDPFNRERLSQSPSRRQSTEDLGDGFMLVQYQRRPAKDKGYANDPSTGKPPTRNPINDPNGRAPYGGDDPLLGKMGKPTGVPWILDKPPVPLKVEDPWKPLIDKKVKVTDKLTEDFRKAYESAIDKADKLTDAQRTQMVDGYERASKEWEKVKSDKTTLALADKLDQARKSGTEDLIKAFPADKKDQVTALAGKLNTRNVESRQETAKSIQALSSGLPANDRTNILNKLVALCKVYEDRDTLASELEPKFQAKEFWYGRAYARSILRELYADHLEKNGNKDDTAKIKALREEAEKFKKLEKRPEF